jgi:hypothetical protein
LKTFVAVAVAVLRTSLLTHFSRNKYKAEDLLYRSLSHLVHLQGLVSGGRKLQLTQLRRVKIRSQGSEDSDPKVSDEDMDYTLSLINLPKQAGTLPKLARTR